MKQKFLMPDGETVEKEWPQWKTPHNHDTEFESDRTALFCNDKSLTAQEFKDETDINVMIERFRKSGQPPPMPMPEDFNDQTGRATYFQMQERIAEANAIFYTLDAKIRAESNNDPQLWADQVVLAMDKRDGDRLNELGVALPEKSSARLPPQPRAPEQPPGGSPAPDGNKAPPGGANKAPGGA